MARWPSLFGDRFIVFKVFVNGHEKAVYKGTNAACDDFILKNEARLKLGEKLYSEAEDL